MRTFSLRNEIDCLDDDALEGGGRDVAEVACEVLVVAGDGDHGGVKSISH